VGGPVNQEVICRTQHCQQNQQDNCNFDGGTPLLSRDASIAFILHYVMQAEINAYISGHCVEGLHMPPAPCSTNVDANVTRGDLRKSTARRFPGPRVRSKR
jgi:hypothetical protein